MTNINLIESAVKIVNDYWDAEGIYETNDTIRARVTRWYNNTDIAEAQMLAAVAISGEYQVGITYDEIREIEAFYFPQAAEVSFRNSCYDEYLNDNFSIAEIEEAQHDEQWWS